MPPRINRANRIAPRQLLTRLVLRKVSGLSERRRHFFSVWKTCRRVEYLGGGIPYKVTADPRVATSGGVFVGGLNRPIILVSSGLSLAERRQVAMHELLEWERSSGAETYKNDQNWRAHLLAIRRQHPGLTHAINAKLKRRGVEARARKRNS